MIDLTNNINPTQEYISEWKRLENGMVAHRYGICSTSLVCYAVYEPTSLFSGAVRIGYHSTITHESEFGGWLGDITTRDLPPELDALPPRTMERSTAVQTYFHELKQQAEEIIRAAFPQDFLSVVA